MRPTDIFTSLIYNGFGKKKNFFICRYNNFQKHNLELESSCFESFFFNEYNFRNILSGKKPLRSYKIPSIVVIIIIPFLMKLN